MRSINLAIVAILFVAAQTCIIASGFVMFAMIGRINERLPQEQRVSYLFGHLGKTMKIFREYRRLYPTGRLRLYFHFFFLSGVSLLLGCAWEIGLLW